MAESSQRKRCPMLVVGIGNILLRDEGFGPHMIKTLQNVELPPSVELLDGGTAGANLIDFICDRQKVIFIDAVQADVEPGSILRLSAEDLTENLTQSISLHEFGLVETLLTAKQLHCAPQEVVIFGVQPKDMDCGIGLSAEIAASVPKVVELVLNEVSE